MDYEHWKDIIMDEVSYLHELTKYHKQISKQIIPIAQSIFDAYENKHRIFICGNGGSAAQASHLVAELMGKFSQQREPIDAQCLSDNMPLVTAWSNDCNYDTVFSRQLNVARDGDVLICFTTSGKSKNIIEAMRMASTIGMTIILFTGQDRDSVCAELAHREFFVESDITPRIQEMHLLGIHLLCTLIEETLFNGVLWRKNSG